MLRSIKVLLSGVLIAVLAGWTENAFSKRRR